MNQAPHASSKILTLAAVVIVIAGLKFAQPLLAPLLLAALITATSAPIAAWLSARGLSASLGAAAALLVGIAFLAGCGALIAYSAADAQTRIPDYWSRAEGQAGALATYLNRFGVHASREAVLSVLDANRVMAVVGSTLSAAADVVPHLVVMPLVVFFALAEIAGFGDKIRAILPDTSKGLEQVESTTREVQKYLLVKTGTSLLAAVLIGIWLTIFKIDFTALLALLVFLLHFIPNLGMAIAMVPGIAVALLQHGPGTAIAVAGGYLVINGIVGNVIEPKVMGRTLGLSPLVVLLAMVFWGWMWGPIGALLSVPLTMIAKIAFGYSENLRWLAILIGPTENLHPPNGAGAGIQAVLNPLLRPGAPVGLGAGRNSLARASITGMRAAAVSAAPTATIPPPASRP